MSKLPPRDNNVDLTRSTMEKTINRLVLKCTHYQEALGRKKKKLSRFNSLMNYLVSHEKIKREEIKKFLKGEQI